MKKRLLSLLLILCLCAALLPVAVFAEGNEIELTNEYIERELQKTSKIDSTGKIIYSYQKALPAGSYRLTGDITLYDEVRIEGSVTIDLNGKTMRRNDDENSRFHAAFSVRNGSHLTLTDSSNGNGAISGFGNSSVHVLAGGVFTMNGGRLLDGTARGDGCGARGGGVLVEDGGLFVMNGGSIENCYANGDGGGVYVNGTFRMTGGVISGCFSEGLYGSGYGGGIYVASNGTFEMTGGTIKNCTADGEGDGVYVADGANATLVRENIEGEITGNWTEYVPPVDPIDPDYPLISILPALAKDLPFADVKSADWFYNDVKYAYETGLMTGTSDTAFSPEAPVTRGMVMTILARCEGIRTDRYTPWYAAGCEWAKANGISNGSNPEAPVTREQLAAMLYRYAALKGRDLTAGENTNILSYTDAFDISDYAIPALQWATGEKILTGSNGALNPQAPATRAHLAAILHRYFG